MPLDTLHDPRSPQYIIFYVLQNGKTKNFLNVLWHNKNWIYEVNCEKPSASFNWINKALGNVSIKHELSSHQSRQSVGVSR